MDNRMNRKEVLAAIKTCNSVLVWVRSTPEDGTYWQVTKTEAKYRITNDPHYNDAFLAHIDEDNNLCIN
jgi:hypothetical protein